jgi:hypothetical protein
MRTVRTCDAWTPSCSKMSSCGGSTAPLCLAPSSPACARLARLRIGTMLVNLGRSVHDMHRQRLAAGLEAHGSRATS